MTPPARRSASALVLAWAGLLGAGCGALYYLPPDTEETPREIRVVTDDLPRFYAAFDQALAEADTAALPVEPFRTLYLDPGSPGLRAFDALSIEGAEKLAAEVSQSRRYYAAVRDDVLRVHADPAVAEAVRAALGRLDAVYPDAAFPDVTFVVGRMRTGGTMAAPGLLIGVEMFARRDGTPVDELSGWQRAHTRSPDGLAHIVAHEAVHAQQPLRVLVRRSLLTRALVEGGADFVASLATGRRLATDAHAFLDANGPEVWAAFADAVERGDPDGWFYGSSLGDGWPADLGYAVGFRIAESHYARSDDKRAALRDILLVRRPERMLRESGYLARPD